MKGRLIDAYRSKDRVVLWIKTSEGDIRLFRNFRTSIYMETSAEAFLKKNGIDFFLVDMMTYSHTWKKVLEIPVWDIGGYESFVSWLEKKTKHKVEMYNADIPPEQQFLYEHDIVPGDLIEFSENSITSIPSDEYPELRYCTVRIERKGKVISRIVFNDESLAGDEKDLLKSFIERFHSFDCDVMMMEYAFSDLPRLDERIKHNGLECRFHRWDTHTIHYKGGKSFYSYGRVRFHDLAVRLRGRFLVDTGSTIGSECDVEGIFELCRLTGSRFQQIASRSFGAVFQQSLVRLMYQKNILIPYKEKPVDMPLNLVEMLKGDRGGHTFDAKVGFHKDVAEIDFSSMYPWIIYNRNISAETLFCDKPPLEKVPDLPIHISHRYKGLIPEAIKPILDARMRYKKDPTERNKRRAFGLKHVLVTAYGYLRFREFKLGVASSHMAICAYARSIILDTARLAEKYGFRVVHGIVDSIYIKKKGISEEDVAEFCKELEHLVGIPVSFEGIFKWITFLPSVNDASRPLPATYYGVFQSGKVKARGIEVRHSRTPALVREFQEHILEDMCYCNTRDEIRERVPSYCRLVPKTLDKDIPRELLEHKLTVSKSEYKHNLPQKKVIARLKRKGIKVLPGQTIRYVMQRTKPVLPEDYNGKPDIDHYRKLLVRCLFVMFQPFGFTRDRIKELAQIEKQTRIKDFLHPIRHVYIPISPRYHSNKGLSEKQIKKVLEKQGWEVWRGGLIDITRRPELYPNVLRKYSRLIRLLEAHHHGTLEELQYMCSVHHGMPDFICYRNGEFRFIECKLKYEQLSSRQKTCIEKLQDMGFKVEVWKAVDHPTKARVAEINYRVNQKEIFDKQMALMKYT